MKRIFASFVALTLFTVVFATVADNRNFADGYKKMLVPGRTWNLTELHVGNDKDTIRYTTITLTGPVEFDGKECYTIREWPERAKELFIPYYYEEDGKVYLTQPVIGKEPYTYDFEWEEMLDFGAEVGQPGVNKVDTIIDNRGVKRRRIYSSIHPWRDTIVEGIGSIVDGTDAHIGSLRKQWVESVYDGDECIFTKEDFTKEAYHQDLNYDSFLTEGKVWTVRFDIGGNPNVYAIMELKLEGDTIIDGIHFRQTYYRSHEANQPMPETWEASGNFLGEQDGKVYIYNRWYSKSSDVVMDFSLKEGDVFDYSFHKWITYKVTAVNDTILPGASDGRPRKCLHLSDLYCPEDINDVWVEGIGSLRFYIDLYDPWEFIGSVRHFLKCVEGDRVLYQNPTISGIQLPKQPVTVKPAPFLYDLQGRRLTVEPQQKGVYIRGGKKYIMK